MPAPDAKAPGETLAGPLSLTGKLTGSRTDGLGGAPASWGAAALALLGAAVWAAVFAAGVSRQGAWRLQAPVLLALGALPSPLGGRSPLRLASTWLVHVDALHLSGSVLALSVLAVLWPARRRGLLLALIGCGLGGSMATLLGYGGRLVVSAGPSAALLGAALLGAALPQRAWRRAVLLLTGGALLLGPGLGDHAAHAGGALTGAVLAGLVLVARGRQSAEGAAARPSSSAGSRSS